MKFLKYFLLFLMSLYLIMCLGLYFNQEKLMFFPRSLSDHYTPTMGVEVWIPVEEDVRINATLITYPKSKGVILYLHGNVGNVQHCLRQTRQFQNLGYDIMIPDYRSYGKSGGDLQDEAQMYQDMQIVYDYLAKRYEHIVLLGYSMGTGMVSYLAAHNPSDGLILVAPYVSLVDMKNRVLPIVPNFLMKYQFCTNKNLKNVKCPITLMHGTNDEVIPFASSEQLHEQYPDTKFIPLQGVSHRGIIFNQAVRKAVETVVSQ